MAISFRWYLSEDRDSVCSRFDSRVKVMEVDEKPTEEYSDIGGLDKQISEVCPTDAVLAQSFPQR